MNTMLAALVNDLGIGIPSSTEVAQPQPAAEGPLDAALFRAQELHGFLVRQGQLLNLLRSRLIG